LEASRLRRWQRGNAHMIAAGELGNARDHVRIRLG
jgi:hypothetical protein